MPAFPKERHSSESRKTYGIMSIASFAGRKIGHGGCEHGYQSVEYQWLCEECYANMLSIDPLGLFTNAAEVITNY
jgi:hypothetical protein